MVAELNDYQFKLSRIEGDFVWHDHAETDEAFLVLEGELRIDFRDGQVLLRPGELFVVPRGVEHKPFAGKGGQAPADSSPAACSTPAMPAGSAPPRTTSGCSPFSDPLQVQR